MKESFGLLANGSRRMAQPPSLMNELFASTRGANDERLFDFEITLKADDKEIVLGDTKEGSMAVRIAETMRLTHGKKPGDGHIVQSTGIKDDDTWANMRKWCDYYGPVAGKTVALPSSTTRQIRDTRPPGTSGTTTFAANPFGCTILKRKTKGLGI